VATFKIVGGAGWWRRGEALTEGLAEAPDRRPRRDRAGGRYRAAGGRRWRSPRPCPVGPAHRAWW